MLSHTYILYLTYNICLKTGSGWGWGLYTVCVQNWCISQQLLELKYFKILQRNLTTSLNKLQLSLASSPGTVGLPRAADIEMRGPVWKAFWKENQGQGIKILWDQWLSMLGMLLTSSFLVPCALYTMNMGYSGTTQEATDIRTYNQSPWVSSLVTHVFCIENWGYEEGHEKGSCHWKKNSSLQLKVMKSSPQYSTEREEASSRSKLCQHLYVVSCHDIKLYEFSFLIHKTDFSNITENKNLSLKQIGMKK